MVWVLREMVQAPRLNPRHLNPCILYSSWFDLKPGDLKGDYVLGSTANVPF